MSDPVRDEHAELRESLGAWVLGSLDGPDRRRVQAHIATCDDCRDEVALLSPLPGLLHRVTETEVAQSNLVPAPGMGARLAVRAALSEAALRARMVRWRAAAFLAGSAAAVATAAVVVTAVQDPAPTSISDRLVAPVVAAVEDAPTTGVASAYEWEWGTTVELDVADLPPRDRYSLWAVSREGLREPAGTWGPTASGGARVRGASSIQRGELETVEITDSDGRLVATFDFDQAVLEPDG